MHSVLVICLSPTFQQLLVFPSFHENEVNRTAHHTLVASGKGVNVSRVLGNLGVKSKNLMQLGGKRVEEFLFLMQEENLELEYLPVQAPIRVCTTIINEEKETSTELVEEAMRVEDGASEALFSLFLKELEHHDAIIISGTKAKGFSSDLYPRMVKAAKEKGKMVVLDLKGEDLKNCLREKPSVIKPNLVEFLQTFTEDADLLENDENESFQEKVKGLMQNIFTTYGTKTVITRGKWDSWVYDGVSFSIIPNDRSVKVVNTIGCGDTLTAALTAKLLQGEDLASACAFGMACATKKAMHLEQGIQGVSL